MSRLANWDTAIFIFGYLTIVVGFPFLIVLAASSSPLPAVVGLFGLGFLGIVAWWMANRLDTFDTEIVEEVARERDSLSVLKERYARGELSEEELEHRVTVLLNIDNVTRSKRESEQITERE